MGTAAAQQTQEDQSSRAGLIRLFNDTRKRLVETGTRNRLVHVNRANTRGNTINAVNERSDDVFSILTSGKAMRFLGLGHDKEEEQGIYLADAHEEPGEQHYTDMRLETRLGPDALQKKLLKIAREAQTAEEESGVNILYLALGFLTWFEDKASSIAREAPLVLVPVELVRNARTSTFDIRMRDDELHTNLPLKQRLKDDFGIDVPDLEISAGWEPSRYFDNVAEVIATRERWKVVPDAIQLGFFSFSKLLMYRDLAIEAWPDGALADHALTRGLLYEGFEREAPMFGPGDRLDDMLPPEKLFHVVDADASQAKVVEEVRSGRNLVVQGPPGTGKSQTITNIIAAASDGKHVLFVAEKMAALSVVHDRLVKVGLRDICLELHSRSANKKAVLGELARTIGKATAVPNMPGGPAALHTARDRLNALAEALHRPIGSTGETAFSVLGRQSRFIGMKCSPPNLGAESLSTMSREQEAQLIEIVQRYGALLASDSRTTLRWFEGVRNLDLQPVDLARLVRKLDAAVKSLDALAFEMAEANAALSSDAPVAVRSAAPLCEQLQRLEGLPHGSAATAKQMLSAPDLRRLCQALRAGAAWRAAHDENATAFADAAFTSSTAHLRAPLIAGTRSFFGRWGRTYRKASIELAALLRGNLPKTAGKRVALIDALDDVAAKRRAWEGDQDYCSTVLSREWRAERTDFAGLRAVADWCDRLCSAPMLGPMERMIALAERTDAVTQMRPALRHAEAAVREAVPDIISTLDIDAFVFRDGEWENTDIAALSSRFRTMQGAIDGYAAWTQLARHHAHLVEAGLAPLAIRMRRGELDSEAAAVELRFARAERLWKTALQQSPLLRGVAMEKRHDLVATFAALERKRLSDTVTGILAGHLAQVPQGAMGEMRVVRGEIGKKQGHMALRKLFAKAGNAIQRIKPVLLMSPISVAQFLPPGNLSFDLLVIDEASQVRPEDALGAIARVKQIVVVGDKKQLPPSAFFDRLLAGDAEDDEESDGDDLLGGAAKLGAMESILTLCEARGLGSRMLTWHYRSRDPSLIAVSNREFYENALILPPSPLQQDPAYGLCFTRVDGAYDRGGKRDNRKEGEAIVARVAEHARAHSTLSLGVVTFSFAQRNLITELMELHRRTDPVLDGFLSEGQHEDVFVKNIENVQGDERDVILVSVGYGPTTPGGRLGSMSFGPINSEGGERRLNVLFTRARVRCEVFASFDPEDIDVLRTSGDGPRVLKRFLEFAKSGRLDDSSPTGLDADSPFEEDVAEIIRSFGFLADPQVGSAGFRIDMGVRHPDKPGTCILAVECDGATYHNALWARERDRLRQDVLESLGWRFHRIWSTDWFYNRASEIERLRNALGPAREAAARGIRIDGVNKSRPAPVETTEAKAAVFDIPETPAREMPAYARAWYPVSSSQEPHEVSVPLLADLASRIVSAEGPIHVEEVSRRVAACFRKEKAGVRIFAATEKALAQAQSRDGELLSDDDFWYTREQSRNTPVRDRSRESGATLKAACISMLEIRAALRIAEDDNGGGDEADLVRAAARLLGFRRVGSDLQTRIASGLTQG